MEQVHLFTKKLKPTHIGYTLSVPTHVLEAFPFPEGAHTMKFEAVDATDNAWTFCLSTRLTYPKPVLLRSHGEQSIFNLHGRFDGSQN
jgi:hypothetical protein